MVDTAKAVIKFYNAVWGKALGLETPGNIATVSEALAEGYKLEQLRVAIFASRYATDWFAKYKRDLSVILRFKCPKGEPRILDGLIAQGIELDYRKPEVTKAAAEVDVLKDAAALGATLLPGIAPVRESARAVTPPPPMTSEQRERVNRAFAGVDAATKFPAGGEKHRAANVSKEDAVNE